MHASASTPRLARGIEARGAASQPLRAFLLLGPSQWSLPRILRRRDRPRP